MLVVKSNEHVMVLDCLFS